MTIETRPLDMKILQDVYPITQGNRDLLLGQSKRVTLGGEVVIDMYPRNHVISVQSPLIHLDLLGVRQVTVNQQNGIIFQVERDGHRGSITFSPTGEITFEHVSSAGDEYVFKPTAGFPSITIEGYAGQVGVYRESTLCKGQMEFFVPLAYRSKPKEDWNDVLWYSIYVFGEEALAFSKMGIMKGKPLRVHGENHTRLEESPFGGEPHKVRDIHAKTIQILKRPPQPLDQMDE